MSKKGKARRPKKKCCASRPRCTRCPLRMLAEGTLPAGYTVRKRRLVTLEGTAAPQEPKQLKKSRSKPSKKSRKTSKKKRTTTSHPADGTKPRRGTGTGTSAA